MSADRVGPGGSEPGDGRRRVVVDRRNSTGRWRYACPNGHVNWDRTNGHVWCPECQRARDAGEDVDAEHHELLDKKRDELVPWSAVEVID
ncbi:hypothetical protein ACFQE1_07765 [Halobium palmae]|uniref:Zinc-ribbon domain-containing protein n=1 Tax=Halobium palmae TaxID=1776492 RepID=A0ABD5RYK5_9EURY